MLRQPTKKERILSSVWGRLAYFAEIGAWAGPAVFLEAQPVSLTTRWSRSLNPEEKRELERLRQDGHKVTLERKHYAIHSDFDAIRATQLYRTLPHEIGHYAQYYQQVESKAGDDDDEFDRLRNFHFARPSREREDFAHRYADELRATLVKGGNWPFDKIVDVERTKARGLEPEWFGL